VKIGRFRGVLIRALLLKGRFDLLVDRLILVERAERKNPK